MNDTHIDYDKRLESGKKTYRIMDNYNWIRISYLMDYNFKFLIHIKDVLKNFPIIYFFLKLFSFIRRIKNF